MRAIRTFKSIMRNLFGFSVEPALSESELNGNLEVASNPHFGFYFMLAAASLIATFGLLGNSAATIIGAMIVAPLMNPIVALAFALVTGHKQWAIRSMFTICNGAIMTVAIGWLMTTLLTVSVVQSEVISRTNPTALDWGVAFAAGAAAGFANTRNSIVSSIAGVAIAVALVPPLSVIGIGLALGNDAIPGIGLRIGHNGLAYGAALLFLTNLVCIVLSSGIVFALQGYGSVRNAVIGLGGWLAIALAIFLPLGKSFQELLLRNQVRVAMIEYRKNHPEMLRDARLLSYSVEIIDDRLNVEVEGISPSGFSETEMKAVRNHLAEQTGYPVQLEIRWIPIDIRIIRVEN